MSTKTITFLLCFIGISLLSMIFCIVTYVPRTGKLLLTESASAGFGITVMLFICISVRKRK